jgi:hypothetical protein
MPSPRGSNRARLFVDRNPRGAYDEKMSEADGSSLVAFLTDKLSPEDLAEFCKMAGIDAGAAMDEPADFEGKPKVGGGMGQDARHRASFAQRFPHAAKIKVSR